MTVMLRSDAFLLERMHTNGAMETGIYAAGFRLLDAFNMVGFLMAGFLMPFISRHWPEIKRFAPVLLACRHLLMLGSIYVAAFSLAAPEYIIHILYNRNDAHTVEVMQIILLTLPALSIIHIYGTTLTATRNIKIFLRISLFFSLIAVMLNLIFIPMYGAKGCAIIAVSAQSLYSISLAYFARIKTGISLELASMPFYLASGILCFGIIRITNHYNGPILLSAFTSISLFSILFFLKSGISFRQMKSLLIEK
jgi:O-antigen/teichoic acid export membrane protein